MSDQGKELMTANGQLVVAGFLLTKSGIEPQGEPSFEDWRELGRWLQHCDGSVHWWIGDWLNYGEVKWSKALEKEAAELGFTSKTLANDKNVAGAVDFSRRREKLSWSHHAEVATLQPDEQESLLGQAEQQTMTRQQLRQAVKEHKQQDKPEQKFCMPVECEAITKWLTARRDGWPDGWRDRFTSLVKRIISDMEVDEDES